MAGISLVRVKKADIGLIYIRVKKKDRHKFGLRQSKK